MLFLENILFHFSRLAKYTKPSQGFPLYTQWMLLCTLNGFFFLSFSPCKLPSTLCLNRAGKGGGGLIPGRCWVLALSYLPSVACVILMQSNESLAWYTTKTSRYGKWLSYHAPTNCSSRMVVPACEIGKLRYHRCARMGKETLSPFVWTTTFLWPNEKEILFMTYTTVSHLRGTWVEKGKKKMMKRGNVLVFPFVFMFIP